MRPLTLVLLVLLGVGSSIVTLKVFTPEKLRPGDLATRDTGVSLSRINEAMKGESKNLQAISELRQQQYTILLSLENLQSHLEALENRLVEVSEIQVTKEDEMSENDISVSDDGVQIAAESKVGQYMDATIEGDMWDEDSTYLAQSQTQKILADMPGVLLDDMQCSDTFCRARFTSVDGRKPNLDDVWGKPPFMHEGFTLPQPDGGVLLYFTDESQSLENIREIAANESS